MDIAQKIHIKLEKVLNRLKVIGLIQTYKLEINFCQVEEHLKASLIEIDSILKKCLHKIINKPRSAEIRNVITELVRKKNSAVEVKGSHSILKSNDAVESCGKSELKFSCTVCGEKFYSKKALLNHKTMHNTLKKYLCEVCGKIFSNSLQCNCSEEECNQHSDFPLDFKASTPDNHEGNSDVFPSYENSVEITSNVSNVTVKQQETKMSFNSSNEKRNLENKTSNRTETKFSCECGKSFRLLKTLRKHEKLKHSAKNVNYNCATCKKFFEERGKLNRHMLIHKSTRYDCSFCSKPFARSDALKRHLSLVHYSSKEFSCGFCDKKFNLKYNKNVHEENFHKNVNSWIQCDQCGQKCRNKITFKSHLKTHSEKRISCKVCSKSFIRKSQYKNHMKNKHSGISPYQTLLDSLTREQPAT